MRKPEFVFLKVKFQTQRAVPPPLERDRQKDRKEKLTDLIFQRRDGEFEL